MTGLDDTKDHILEAACLITDQDLNIVAEGPNIIINQPQSILDGMVISIILYYSYILY
jgi:oligoribonuclease